MNHIFGYLVILAMLGMSITACEQNPSSNANDTFIDQPMKSAAGGAASPAVVYTESKSIYVMDNDGSDQTKVYTPSTGVVRTPSWSPSNSICWIEYSSSISSSAIRSADISVSGGVPIASNIRTIASISGSDNFQKSSWSATSANNTIAFTISSSSASLWTVCRISASGGTWDTLYQTSTPVCGLSWNPDDTKLAVYLRFSASSGSFVILNNSTRTVTDSIPVTVGIGSPSAVGHAFEWSRAGSLNKLAYISGDKLYYLTPTNGATPTSNTIGFNTFTGSLTWAPNNSSLMYVVEAEGNSTSTQLKKVTAQTTSIATLDRTFSPKSISWQLNWHR